MLLTNFRTYESLHRTPLLLKRIIKMHCLNPYNADHYIFVCLIMWLISFPKRILQQMTSSSRTGTWDWKQVWLGRPWHSFELCISCVCSWSGRPCSPSLPCCPLSGLHKNIQKLQIVQNAVAWVVNFASYSVYISPLLCEPWLQMCFQMQLKMLIVTFKVLDGLGLDLFKGLSLPGCLCLFHPGTNCRMAVL